LVDLRPICASVTMTNSVVRPQGRMPMSTAMALIAAAAVMVVSTRARHSPLSSLVSLSILLALPFYMLVNLRRPKTTVTMAAAALAMAYLAWGAFLAFWPGIRPDDWAPLDAIHWAEDVLLGRPPAPAFRTSEAVRWNWGLLAAFYAAILVASAAPRVRHRTGPARIEGATPPRAGNGRTTARLRCVPPGAELVLALWFIWNWFLDSRRSEAVTSEWVWPLGLVASLYLAVADWRPRPRSWRLSRFAASVAWLAPDCVGGVITGLVWTAWGWQYAVATAPLILIVVALFARLPLIRRRPRLPVHCRSAPRRSASRRSPIPGRRARILAHLLAAFWWFAISVEVEKSPAHSIGGMVGARWTPPVSSSSSSPGRE